MQNIIEICKSFGIEIPEDKQKDFTSKVAENYKTINEFDKKVERLETERDSFKERAETAEDTLKGFEGKDFETITKERDEWKAKAEQAEIEFSNKLAEREKADLLKDAFSEIKFTSESAKKAIMKEISESITVKNGKLIGFNDLLEEAKKNDASAFVDEEKEKTEQNRAKFTQSMGSHAGENQKKLKDMSLDERIKLKNEDPELYKLLSQ